MKINIKIFMLILFSLEFITFAIFFFQFFLDLQKYTKWIEKYYHTQFIEAIINNQWFKMNLFVFITNSIE